MRILPLLVLLLFSSSAAFCSPIISAPSSAGKPSASRERNQRRSSQDDSIKKGTGNAASDSSTGSSSFGAKSRVGRIMSRVEDVLQSNDLELALRILEHESDWRADSEDLIVARARVLDALNKSKSAVRLLHSYISSFPSALKAKLALGELLFVLGDYSNSKKVLKSLVSNGEAPASGHYRLALLALLEGDSIEAIHQCKMAYAKDQRNFELDLLLARLLVQNKNYSEANRMYSRAIELDSTNEIVIAEQASLCAAMGKSLDAIEKLLRAHNLAPSSVDVIQRFIAVYASRLDWPNASDYAKSWLKFEPRNPRALFISGWCLLNLGEYSEAAATFKECIQLDPRNPALHNAYAFACYEQRKVEDALYEFQQAEELASKNKESSMARDAALNQVVVLASRSRFVEAKRKIETIKSSFGTDSVVDSVAAFVLALEGKTEQAKKIIGLNNLASAVNADPYAIIALSLCLKNSGNLQGAVDELSKLTKTDPNNAYLLYQLAENLLANGDSEKAIQIVQQALQIAPSNLAATAVLARALMKRKNYFGAVPLLKECAVRNPKDLSLRLDLALAQIGSEQNELAELTYQKALKDFPEAEEPLVGLAKIAILQKQFSRAEAYARDAILVQPTNREAYYLLAQALYMQKRYSESSDAIDVFGDFSSLPLNVPLNLDAASLKASALYRTGEQAQSLKLYSSIWTLHKELGDDRILEFAAEALRENNIALASELINFLDSRSKQFSETEKNQFAKLKSKLTKTKDRR